MIHLNDYEVRFLNKFMAPTMEDNRTVRLINDKYPRLTHDDCQQLADILERYRHTEQLAMTIAPPKHSASRLSEEWAASFWLRLNFLDMFIHHLRGVSPAPEPSGQLLSRSLI